MEKDWLRRSELAKNEVVVPEEEKEVAAQLYSRGRVDPVPDPPLLRQQRRPTFFYITYINSVRTSQETQYISAV
jgi:hypothetical protein